MQRQIARSREVLDAGFPLVVMDIEQKANAVHSHDFYEMVYVRRGRGTHVIEDTPYPIRAGDFYFLRPGEAHVYMPDGDLRIVNVLWQPSLVSELLKADADTPLKFIESSLQSGSEARTVLRRLHFSGSAAFRVEHLLDEMRHEVEAAQRGTPAVGCHSLLRHLFCALLVQLVRAGAAAGAPLSKTNRSPVEDAGQNAVGHAIAYLETHLAETIRVSQVATHVALSSGRLAHLFKTHTGRSIIEYVHELRFEKACLALRTTTLPVQEIAGETGYNDISFFYQIFRRHAGCNPTEYRSRFLTSDE